MPHSKPDHSLDNLSTLMQGANHTAVEVRLAAARQLGHYHTEQSVQCLKTMLQDGAPAVRVQAAVSLIRHGNEPLYKLVVSALRHTDSRVAIGAALSLGHLAQESAVEPLLEAFRSTNAELGAAIAWALGRCKDKRALPALLAAVKANFVCAQACEALGCIGDPSATSVLVEALTTDCEDVRACAARALAQLEFPDKPQAAKGLKPHLETLLQDSSRKVRLCASLTLHALHG